MTDNPDNSGEPANLRFLRILVTILTASMIAGLVTIIVLIVIRVPNVIRTVEDPLPLPEAITLPEGVKAQTFTRGPNWYAVVTEDNEILIYDLESGELKQTVSIE